jgi:hypothetical protein
MPRLEQEQEQFERARDASIRAAGSTGSSSSAGGSSSSEGAGQAASSRRASSRACRPRTGVAGASGVNYSRQEAVEPVAMEPGTGGELVAAGR